MANNWWWALLLFVGLCNGPSFVLAASGDAGDIMFVLDGSGSISAEDFGRAKTFISQVVDAFDIAADFTRVGLVQFGSLFREEFALNAYSDKTSLQQAISNIDQIGGGTLIGQVIHYLIGTSFTEAKGARPLSEGIPRIAVFITDGAANDNPDTVLPQAISALQASTIIPFSIGVGNDVNADQLLAVAGDSDRVFQVGTYSVIDSIRELLVERVRVIIESPSSPRPELPLTSRPPTMAPTSTQRRTTQKLSTPRATTQKLKTTSTATTQKLMTSTATTQHSMTSPTTQAMTPITMTQLINTSTATIKTKTATPTNTLYYIAGGVGGALLLIVLVVIIIVVIKCRKRQDDEPEAPQEDPFKREELGPREFVFNNPAFGSSDQVPTNRWQEAAGYSDPAPEEPVYVNTTFSGGKNTQENEYVYRG
ncbi:PREDICTED: matrilin-2-like [Branchiostoma belcheri]|uniref:Matrilin-2-like n=1 Tax=Branchiostoma belcheri TaxID=7741 RepID=A0A6P4ZPS8_BRABE|nr:PREDICTED: matrilin-2-like [Branchiostoma belcheri]